MSPTTTPEALTATLTTIAQLGFTAWLAWYLVSTALPNLAKQQDAQIAALTKAHSERLTEQRTDFLTALREERTARAEDTHRIIEAVKDIHQPKIKMQPHI